jgi:hypothetical protein
MSGRFSIEISPQPKAGASCNREIQLRDRAALRARDLRDGGSAAALRDHTSAPTAGLPRPSPAALADKPGHDLHRARPRPQAPESRERAELVSMRQPAAKARGPDRGRRRWRDDNAYCGPNSAPGQALSSRALAEMRSRATSSGTFQQAGDYRYRSCSLNRKQMKLEADGRFRFVVSRRIPARSRELIDTEGQLIGSLYWRFLCRRRHRSR